MIHCLTFEEIKLLGASAFGVVVTGKRLLRQSFSSSDSNMCSLYKLVLFFGHMARKAQHAVEGNGKY